MLTGELKKKQKHHSNCFFRFAAFGRKLFKILQTIQRVHTSIRKCHTFILLSLFSSAFSLSIRTHACGLLRVICQIWRGEVLGTCCPPSPSTFHLSPFFRTCAIQRPALTFELWECRSGCSRCCKGDSSVSHPVYPSDPSSLVVVVLCSCSPGLRCGGSCPGSDPSTWPGPDPSSCVTMWRCADLDLGMMNTCINGKIPMHIVPLPVMQGITQLLSL